MTHQNKLSVTVIAAGLMAPLLSKAQATPPLKPITTKHCG